MRAVIAAGLTVALLGAMSGGVTLAAGTTGPAPPSPTAVATPTPLPLSDLVERAAELDGSRVTVTGEVVGEVLRREGYGWLNINDGTNAVGVLVSPADLALVRHVGGFGVRGDRVLVTGTFYRMDPRAGGDLDVRAERLEVVEPGGRVPVPVTRARVGLAAALSVTGGLAGVAWWRRRNHGRA